MEHQIHLSKLRKWVEERSLQEFNQADRLTIIAAELYRLDPETFMNLDNLTWPDGQAILLSSNRQNIERTNRTAEVKSIGESGFFLDTGHDTAAKKRLLETMMRKLGYGLGITNQVKDLFEINDRHKFQFSGYGCPV